MGHDGGVVELNCRGHPLAAAAAARQSGGGGGGGGSARPTRGFNRAPLQSGTSAGVRMRANLQQLAARAAVRGGADWIYFRPPRAYGAVGLISHWLEVPTCMHHVRRDTGIYQPLLSAPQGPLELLFCCYRYFPPLPARTKRP